MSKKGRAELILLGMTLIWGSTFVVVKIGLAEISPLQFIGIRFTIAAVLLLIFSRRRIFPLTSSAVIKGSVLGVFLFLGFVSQTIGLTLTTASKSAFITGMMVMFVPFLQFVIEKRPPRPGNILGIMIVLLGLWFLTSPAGSTFNAGDALTIVCALLFGVYIVYLDVIAGDMNPEQLAFLQLAVNAVLAGIAVALFEPVKISFSLTAWSVILYLAFFATLLTTYLQTRYQKETTPTRAVVIFTIEPVFAGITASVVLGEHLGGLGILGGALIIGGVLVSEFSDSLPFFKKFSPAEE